MTEEQIKLISENPKAFLLQGRKAKELIKAKQERIDSWRRMAESITVPFREDAGTGGSLFKQSTVANAVCNIVDIESEIAEEVNTLASIEKQVNDAIRQFVVDDRYKAVLEMRYLNGYSWRTIGAKLYYGEDWVCRLHGRALQEMKENAEKRLSS